VYRAVNQGVFASGQGIAYEPWKNWRDGTTSPERIVRAGILAANPHNSQPWHFRINEQAVDLYADYSRQIGVIDPLRREMHIGLGCAVENMILATQTEGFDVQVSLLPDSKYVGHVAHLALRPTQAQASDLFAVIPSRHTNRGPYDLSKSVVIAAPPPKGSYSAPAVLPKISCMIESKASNDLATRPGLLGSAKMGLAFGTGDDPGPVVVRFHRPIRVADGPKKGRVVRVERPSRPKRPKLTPPGLGAFTEEQLQEWYASHPKAKVIYVGLVNGKRTRDQAYTFEELWWNEYFYAITRVFGQTGTEVWINEEGDGKVIGIERPLP